MYEDRIAAVVDRIVRDFDTKAIIIFGPVADGTADEDSDLGVVVILDTGLSIRQRSIAVRRSIGDIGMPFEVLTFTPEEANAQRMNPWGMLEGILSSGKVVYGSI